MESVRLAGVMLLLSCLASGCASSGLQVQSRASRQSVRNESGALRFPYELPKSAGHLSLSLTLRVSAGSFVYTLVDPRGTPTWQGRVNAGQSINESRTLKPAPGKWILTLAMESATGGYDVVWKSE